MAQTSRFSTQGQRPADWASRWAATGEYALIACLFVMPLFFGGRHDLGRLIYAICVIMAATSLFVSYALRGKSMRLPMWGIALFGSAVALLVLQSIPLPNEVIQYLAPGQGELLPLWQCDAAGYSLGEWRTLSFVPSETREGAALLALHGLFFVTVCARIRKREDVERLLRWVAYAAAGMALFGLVQYATSNGKLLWIYEHPTRDFGRYVQGAFANKNHFAHYLVLGLGPLVWIALQALAEQPSHRGARRKSTTLSKAALLALFAVAAVVIAILASKSRGGVLAFSLAAAATLVLQWIAGRLYFRHAFGLITLALAAMVGVSMVGYEEVTGHLDDLVSGEIEQLDQREGRRLIWQANVAAFSTWPLLGAGAGGHAETYPIYFTDPYQGEFTHAESGYLQIASETGAAGLGLLVAAIIICSAWVVRGAWLDKQAGKLSLWAAVIPGLLASLVHSAVDFVWFIPGLLVPTLVLVACAARLHAIAVYEESAERRLSSRQASRGFGPVFGVASIGLASLFVLTGPGIGALEWDRYRRCSSNIYDLTVKLIRSDGKPQDQYLPDTIREHTRLATELLEEIIRCDPSNARAHSRLAGRYLQRFELETADHPHQMSISDVRQVAIDSEFESREAMIAWLRRAYGEPAELLIKGHEHARRAVELCPLQGQAYLYLADLAMFEPQSDQAIASLVDQALRVRPYKGTVLFEAGRQLAMTGDHERAKNCWRESLRRPGSHRHKLVALVAASAPAKLFLADLQPDRAALDLAIRQYQLHDRMEDLRDLGSYAMKQAREAELAGEEDSTDMAARWRQVSNVLRLIEEFEVAAECAQRAALFSPFDFSVRHELAAALFHAEKYADADPHLRWCLSRRPDLKHLQRWLTEATKQRTQVAKNRKTRLMHRSALSTRRPWDAISASDPRETTEVAATPESTQTR